MSQSRLSGLVLVVLASACSSPSSPPPDPGWMANLDDARLLSELSIPGTHESAALYEPIMGTAKCQTMTLEEQLEAGVRYFDIRCRHMDDAFAIYHGPVSELLDFDQVTTTMLDFLDKHPTETVLMSIKEESVASGATRSFEATFASYVAKNPDRWHLGASIPSLGEMRGKIGLVRRFSATAAPLGIDASSWADNTTFSITNADASLRIQDAYKVTDDDAKWMAIAGLLAEARTADGSRLFLDYTSGYQSKNGLPNTPSVANVINPQIDVFLRDPANEHAHVGVLVMDLVTKTRVVAVARINAP